MPKLKPGALMRLGFPYAQEVIGDSRAGDIVQLLNLRALDGAYWTFQVLRTGEVSKLPVWTGGMRQLSPLEALALASVEIPPAPD